MTLPGPGFLVISGELWSVPHEGGDSARPALWARREEGDKRLSTEPLPGLTRPGHPEGPRQHSTTANGSHGLDRRPSPLLAPGAR